MENVDLTQTLASDVMTMLSAGGIIIISAIFVLLFVFFKRYKARFVPLLLGILAYVIFIFIGYNILAALLFAIPAMEELYQNRPESLTMIFLVILTAMYTAARIVFLKIMNQNYNKPGDILNVGLGIGIGDAVLYALSTLTLVTWCAGINSVGLEEIFKDVSSEQVISTYESISTLFTSQSIVWALLGISAVIDIILSILLTVVTFGTIEGKLPSWWYAVTGVVQFVVVLPFKIYDESSLMSIIILFTLKLAMFIAVFVVVYRIDQDKIGGILTYKEKSGPSIKKSNTMPKFGNLHNK